MRYTHRFIQSSAFALVALSGCSTDSHATTKDAGSEPVGEWSLVLEQLDAALISVAGSSADDVYAVGANLSGMYRKPAEGVMGPLVIHFDGERLRRVAVDVESHLWWVHVVSSNDVFLGGTGGTVLRGNAEDGFDVLETPGSDTVYGIWGSADDLWAVGGEPDVAPGFVWRFDGDSFRDVTDELPEWTGGGAPDLPAIFKVFGRDADDVWFVGMEGLAAHWDGKEFAFEDARTERRLFTVHGAPEGQPKFVAVGGFGDAVIVEYDGDGWQDVTPEGAIPQTFGVFMDAKQSGYAVGLEGSVMRRDASGWRLVETGVDLIDPFHAVWVDPEGGVWAVGGDVLTPWLNQGMLLRYGEPIDSEVEGL